VTVAVQIMKVVSVPIRSSVISESVSALSDACNECWIRSDEDCRSNCRGSVASAWECENVRSVHCYRPFGESVSQWVSLVEIVYASYFCFRVQIVTVLPKINVHVQRCPGVACTVCYKMWYSSFRCLVAKGVEENECSPETLRNIMMLWDLIRVYLVNFWLEIVWNVVEIG